MKNRGPVCDLIEENKLTKGNNSYSKLAMAKFGHQKNLARSTRDSPKYLGFAPPYHKRRTFNVGFSSYCCYVSFAHVAMASFETIVLNDNAITNHRFDDCHHLHRSLHRTRCRSLHFH